MSATDTRNDEIKADFLVEAGELVEGLGEKLVALEASPEDPALLNDVFRAFHTVKGGAGFLSLTALVNLCHAAEDVFNVLRAGKRKMDPTLMDAVLQSLDHIQSMMAAVAQDQPLVDAPPSLIATLHALARNEPPPPPRAEPVARNSETISEDEFEALLDQLASDKKPPAALAEAKPPVPAPAAKTPEPSPAAAPVAAAPAVETSVRVDTLKLDKMMNLVGELVLVRNRLKTLRGAQGEALVKAIGQLDFITRNLQGAVMQIRMQPIKKVFSRFPKLARDVARGLGKQVEVELQGEDTDLDKNLVEALADPLMHMVRNSVDHGIEMPEVRTKAGKPAAGKLLLAAQQEGEHILITVKDDGAGMDAEKLRGKAIQKGLLDSATAARMTPEESFQLIFLPGFSTKENISDLSGRGVGMDVVKTAISKLNGSVSIESRVGYGSTIRIRVPLTLAILPGLMVQVADRQFAIPLGAVHDVFALDRDRIRKLNAWDVMPLKRETLRLVYLEHWMHTRPDDERRHVVVVQVGEERYGLVVNLVRGREEVVIKPLGKALQGLAGIAGATVTPEGRVALILDCASLVQAYSRSLEH